MSEAYVPKSFKPPTMRVIEHALDIIAEMARAGYTLTVRQLYYQFVSRDLMANRHANYKRLASIVDDARKAGLIGWDSIEDRTRKMRGFGHGYPLYFDPSEFLTENAKHYYHEDLWDSQPCYVEVWVEKDALLGVIERPANAYRVPHFACRGYASSSALYEAGKRFREHYDRGQSCYLFHLGDHDPSGIDMTRENDKAVNLFASSPDFGEDTFGYVTIERLALNMDQVREYRPPPNPSKEKDSRNDGYKAKYGASSWELDALAPSVIDATIRAAITSVLDEDAWDVALKAETANRDKLLSVAKQWDAVAERFGDPTT